MAFLIRCLSILMINITFCFLAGCNSENKVIQQLREENPFAKEEAKQTANTKYQISCESIRLVAPESFNIENTSLFKTGKIEKVAKSRKSPIINGFSQDQITSWNNAGYTIAIAQVELWNETIANLERFQGENGNSSKLNIYNNPKEFSDIITRSNISNESITVKDYFGNEQSYSLANGEYAFRFQSTIYNLEQLNEGTVNFFLIPVFKEFAPKTAISNIINSPEPVVGFEQLILSGTIKNNYIISITCSQQAIENDMPAAKMLFNKGTNSASIIMFAPIAKKVEYFQSGIPQDGSGSKK